MIFLRQSTASQEVPLGYFLDSTDGNTEETGLTIANTDIKIWKAGATTLANKNSGGATHISNGIYYAVLDATDTDTIGSLKIFVHVSGALAVALECVVLDEAVYDVQFGTTAPATTTNITAGTITTVTNLTNAATNGDLTATMKASVNTEVDTALSDYGALKPTTAGRTLDVTATGEAGIDWANVGSPTTTLNLSGTTIKTATDVETDTADIQTRLPAALVSGRMDSNVQAMGSGVITATVIATGAIDADSLATDAVSEITTAIEALVLETGLTWKNALRLIVSAAAGKASGLATSTAVYRNAVADDKNRISATVDADGNRTAITYDLT